MLIQTSGLDSWWLTDQTIVLAFTQRQSPDCSFSLIQRRSSAYSQEPCCQDSEDEDGDQDVVNQTPDAVPQAGPFTDVNLIRCAR